MIVHSAKVSLAVYTRVPAIVTLAHGPFLIFGFVDTMYLDQEQAYRDLYNSIVACIHNKSYGLGNLYEASARRRFHHICLALVSWAIFPVYLGLIVAYFVARYMGWLAMLSTAVKQG